CVRLLRSRREAAMARTSLGVLDPARELLGLVRETAAELRPGAARAAELDDALEEAGIDSLGRAQLSARIEQRFGVRLPDDVVLGARTARDLLDAIVRAEPTPTPAAPPSAPSAGEHDELELPARATTLV